MHETNAPVTRGIRIKPARGARLLLLTCLLMELAMMLVGLWPAAWLIIRYGPRAETGLQWSLLIIGAVLVFNIGYLVALLAARMLIPKPVEGLFPHAADGNPPPEARRFILNSLLTKARHDPPWAQMFSSVLAQIYPLRPFFERFFGPHGKSVTLGDTADILDPSLVELGEEVVLGFRCCLSAHVFDNRGLYVRRIRIGDRALIGSYATLLPGVEVGEHAVVASHSLVPADTKIPRYEYWGGVPATKIKHLSKFAGQSQQ
jgi:acetyltransferase-like isoleucine patch superfamily enzyme